MIDIGAERIRKKLKIIHNKIREKRKEIHQLDLMVDKLRREL